jgi:hypothetical protein
MRLLLATYTKEHNDPMVTLMVTSDVDPDQFLLRKPSNEHEKPPDGFMSERTSSCSFVDYITM